MYPLWKTIGGGKRKSIAGIVKEEKVIMNKDAASGFTFRRFQIHYIG